MEILTNLSAFSENLRKYFQRISTDVDSIRECQRVFCDQLTNIITHLAGQTYVLHGCK